MSRPKRAPRMRELRLSRRADADLAEIADYTIAAFGTAQARKYRDQLRACFASLCDNPLLPVKPPVRQ